MHITETSFPFGSATAIIGHNGAGKSTFARCLCGLEKHFKGTVQDQSKNYSRKERLKLCYMVMQDVNHQLFTESLLDEILLSMRTENKQRAREILKEMDLLSFEDCHLLGLEDKLKNMPNNLSGGQQQRVAIARALITKPAIVLADEPTGNLDSKTSAEVLGLIKRTSAEFRQTVVMITHNNDIARLADQIVRIEDGKIVE